MDLPGVVYFDSSRLYLESCQGNAAKIAGIEMMIDALMLKAAESIDQADLKEYSINNGQTILRTTYNSMEDIIKAIQRFEVLKQLYVNRVNSRMTRFMDASNFRTFGRYRR